MNPIQFKQLRKDLRYTQSGLAELIGVSENTIANYEIGRVTIPKMTASLVFGLWLENTAGQQPKFADMLSAQSPKWIIPIISGEKNHESDR